MIVKILRYTSLVFSIVSIIYYFNYMKKRHEDPINAIKLRKTALVFIALSLTITFILNLNVAFTTKNHDDIIIVFQMGLVLLPITFLELLT